VEKSPRLLIVGSARASTGFGRVVNCLSDRLSSKYDIHVLGYDIFRRIPTGAWTLHPGTPLDVFGQEQLGDLHGALCPDITLIINDFCFVPAFLAALRRSRHRSKLAMYIPIDALLLDPSKVDPLASVDGIAVYTEFGRRVLLDAFAAGTHLGTKLPMVDIIPHGISTDFFHPTSMGGVATGERIDRIEARRALLGDDPRIEGFWVLNANKNSRRKRLDLTMLGFSLFARDKPPNVRLYLHAGRQDTGHNLQRLARSLALTERLIVTADTYDHPEVTLDRLNLIYNACEVGVNTSIGEGWGLVAFEHGATGAAQVVPRHSALAELWQDAASFVEPVAAVRFGDSLEGKAVSPEGVAFALERLYSNRGYLTQMSSAAYNNATRIEWSWAIVASRWDSFFRALLGREAR
jgi:D-inositol-3-phosphate glycosyltransferase